MRWLAHLLFASGVEQARAVTVYSYTGNLFATITDNTPPAGTYDNTMRLTGWFSIAQPLLPNLSLVDITSDVLDFSFLRDASNIQRQQQWPHSIFSQLISPET